MRAFDHFTPQSLPEALELLGRLNGQARVIAGGTDLMLQLKADIKSPATIINIKRLPELKAISYDESTGLWLGALTTLRDLLHSPIIARFYPSLAQAAGLMASDQIRSFATVGGNLCNASPAADLAPPLIVLDAVAHVAGPRGPRQLSLEAFFLGPGKSALAPDELLQAVSLAPPTGEAVYIKQAPRAFMDLAVVGVGIRLALVESVCQTIRIALAAVAPVPLRARPAEAVLSGHRLTSERIARAAQLAAEASSPIDDVRGSVWYRRRMVEVATRRGLQSLAGI
jgi:aerobic carbon-monoxide dehydrogenase medium subunit